MSVSGAWVLHFSWGCSLQYGSVDITFNNNGTFTGGGNGQWREQDGTLLMIWDTGPAKYGGNVTGNAGSGSMTTFNAPNSAGNGCWFLTRQGVGLEKDERERARAAATHDVAGNAL